VPVPGMPQLEQECAGFINNPNQLWRLESSRPALGWSQRVEHRPHSIGALPERSCMSPVWTCSHDREQVHRERGVEVTSMTTQSPARGKLRRAQVGYDQTGYAVRHIAPLGPHPPTAEDVVSNYRAAIEQELRDILDYHHPAATDLWQMLYYHIGQTATSLTLLVLSHLNNSLPDVTRDEARVGQNVPASAGARLQAHPVTK
jgi:hypothetical protein